MAKILPIAVLLLLAVQSEAGAEWRFAWQGDPSTGGYTCSLSTNAVRVRTGHGSAEANVRLGVQADGFMTLESDSVSFDPETLYETWVRVDDNRMVVRLSQSKDGRTLTFSEEDSISLHRQFETGAMITATMVFAPKGKPVTQQFGLEGYQNAAMQYKGCRGLLLNPGWLGVYMTAAPKDAELLAWIRKNTPYQSTGIQVVTVDPRKEAHRVDLRPGDQILGVNNKPAVVADLIRAMKDLEVGRSIELDVVRDRTRITKTVTRPERATREE
jgi:hypothetical protein